MYNYNEFEIIKNQILFDITNFNSNNILDHKILNNIQNLLNHDKIHEKIDKIIRVNLEKENISDTTINDIKKEVYSIVTKLNIRFDQLLNLFENINQNQIIKIDELAKPFNNIENVFKDNISLQFFKRFSDYGIGKNQKGPGEYALNLCCHNIHFSKNKGDLYIDKIGLVELKMSQSRNTGGRLGYNGDSQDERLNVIHQYKNKIPLLYNQIFNSKGKSISIVPFFELLNKELTLNENETRFNLIKDLLIRDFKNYAIDFAEFCAKNTDISLIKKEYTKYNFSRYRDIEYFDALLLMSIDNNKCAMIKSINDIDFLFDNNKINTAIGIIPTKAGAGREQWTQIKFKTT